jgi:hypothetical protein
LHPRRVLRRNDWCLGIGLEKDRAGPAFSHRQSLSMFKHAVAGGAETQRPLALDRPLRYSTDDHLGDVPPMDQETQKPAPDNETTFTLYRFCLCHGLALRDQERSVQGIELSKLAREKGLPLKKVREWVGPGQWSRSRLYPESFLNEWLARYTEAQAQATAAAAADCSPEPQPAANG